MIPRELGCHPGVEQSSRESPRAFQVSFPSHVAHPTTTLPSHFLSPLPWQKRSGENFGLSESCSGGTWEERHSSPPCPGPTQDEVIGLPEPEHGFLSVAVPVV